MDGLWRDVDLRQAKSLTVIYDSDITHKTEVQRNIGSFAKALIDAYLKREHEERGEQVMPTDTRNFSHRLKYCLLPNTSDGKCGLDDAFMKFGEKAISELIENSLPLVFCKIESEGGTHNLNTEVMFAPEPCGDQSHKNTPRNLQRHVRSLLSWLSISEDYMTVPGQSYYEYQQESGLWKALEDRDEWANLPQKAANLNKWRNRNSSLQKEGHAMMLERLTVKKWELNRPHLLGFKNGVLDLKTGKLEGIRRDHYLTRRLGFDYDPRASCMKWLRWLVWTFNSSETKVKLVRALFRWSLEPKRDDKYPTEAWPILIGEPKRGKGTFLDVLIALAGEAHSTYDYISLASDTGRFQMLGSLISVNTDLKGTPTKNTFEALNKIISNEPIGVRKLYKDGGNARLGTVLWAAANKPLMSNVDDREGIDRRLVYLRFTRKPEKPDPHLSRRLATELPGIFNWVWSMPLDEAIEYIDKYQKSNEAIADHADFMTQTNTVFEWLIDTNIQDDIILPIKELHESYCQWATGARYTPLGRRNFGNMLRKLGAITNKSNGIIKYTIPGVERLDIRGSIGL